MIGRSISDYYRISSNPTDLRQTGPTGKTIESYDLMICWEQTGQQWDHLEAVLINSDIPNPLVLIV